MLSFTERAIASEYLKLAERHVAEGQGRVNAQLALVAKFERQGHPADQAKTLLHLLEETLALQVQARDRLVEEAGEGR
jgi:hypothetical protein